MNKTLYKKLCMNYGKELDKETYEFMEEALRQYDDKLVEQAIKQIIMNDKFMPTLARIIEVIKEQPILEITEEDKLERWEKKGIHPSCLDKTITNERLTDEELAELEEEFKIFEN